MVNLVLGFVVGLAVGGGGVFAITKAKAQQQRRFPPPNQGFPPPNQGFPPQQPGYPPNQGQQPPRQW